MDISRNLAKAIVPRPQDGPVEKIEKTEKTEKKDSIHEGFVADVFVGANKGLQETVEGITTMILHPIQTLKGLGYAITHPAQAVKAMVDPYVECFKSGHPGEALGRGVIDFGDLFLGKVSKGKKLADASQLSQLSQLSEISEISKTAQRAQSVLKQL